MSEKKTLTFSVIWKFFERASVQIINLVTQIVLARLIGPEHFGSLSLIVVIYNLADIFLQKGFSSSIIRKKEVSKADLDSTFIVSMLLSVILYISMFLFAPVIGKFYNNEALVNSLRVLSINLLIAPFYCVGNAILIRDMQFRTIFYRGLFAALISGGTGILLAFQGFGLWALVAQMLVNQFVITFFIIFKTKWLPGTCFSYASFKEVFSFGKNILLTEFLLNLVESLRMLVIGKEYSETDLAYYDRGQVYPATLMRAINGTLFSTLLPHLSKLQNDKKKLVTEYVRLTYLSLFFIVPVYFGFAAVAKEIVLLLLSEKWLPSVPYIPIFCVYQAIFPYQITGKIVVYAVGNSKKILRIEIVKSIISFLLMVVAMHLGVIYIALSLIVVRIISDLLYLLSAEKEIETKIHLLLLTWKPFAAATLMYFAVSAIGLLKLSTIFILVIKLILGLITYTVVFYLLDRELIRSLLKNGKSLIKNKQ